MLRMTRRLSVRRVSSKIAKKSTTRPAPKFYHIHQSCFRELVQELTGKDFEPATKPPPAASNGRLQKFAPLPLGPLEILPPAERLNVDRISVSPIPILFSPVGAFTPMDWTWVDDTSASLMTSLAYRQLAESFVEQADWRSQEEKAAAFPLSPTFCWQSIKNPRDSNLSSPRPQRSSSPRWGDMLSMTLGLGSPGSFAGCDLGTIQ